MSPKSYGREVGDNFYWGGIPLQCGTSPIAGVHQITGHMSPGRGWTSWKLGYEQGSDHVSGHVSNRLNGLKRCHWEPSRFHVAWGAAIQLSSQGLTPSTIMSTTRKSWTLLGWVSLGASVGILRINGLAWVGRGPQNQLNEWSAHGLQAAGWSDLFENEKGFKKMCFIRLSSFSHMFAIISLIFPIIFAIFEHPQRVPMPPAASNSAANRNHDYGGWMYSAAWDQQTLGAHK